MSINQISTDNTFGQLITAVSALVAVSNNFTDGPESQTGSTWTFTNPDVGVNVLGTILATIANVGTLNLETGNLTYISVGTADISVANVTVANVDGATIQNLVTQTLTTTDAVIANAEVAFIHAVSANLDSANIGSVGIGTLDVEGLTVATLNASFANITTLAVSGTFQSQAIIAVLTTTDNANVIRLNTTTANITHETVGTSNISTGNITTLTVGTLNLSVANITGQTLGTLNVTFANVTSETVGLMNASTANITSGNLVTINVSSANITTLTTLTTISANPTANLGIATKNYVDTGASGNLVTKLAFGAKGDILAGNGTNAFSVITSGVNGQSLIVDTQTSTGLRWANTGPTQIFRGLSMGTSLNDKVANGTQLIVYSLAEAIMDDGELVVSWPSTSTIDITASGAGGLDGGSANANTWYEVYAIRKRSDGTKNFILHRALDRNPDQNTMNFLFYPTVAATLGIGANSTIAGANARLAQSFTPNVSGPLTSIEVRAYKTGATANGNVWLTVEGNTAGSPNGTTLAISRKMDIARLQITTASNLRFVFDTTMNVNSGTSYFWVYNADNQGNTTLFTNLVYSLANTDIGANGVNRGLPKGNSIGGTWTTLTPGIGTFLYKAYIESNNNPVTMPAGYDQKCLISYAATDVNSKWKEYHQMDRTIQTYFNSQWAATPLVFQIQNPEVVDLLTVVPPVPCLVSFLAFSGNSLQSIGYGRFHALDIVASISETLLPGTTFGCTCSTTTVVQSLPIRINNQAVLMRIAVASTKIYPCTITF